MFNLATLQRPVWLLFLLAYMCIGYSNSYGQANAFSEVFKNLRFDHYDSDTGLGSSSVYDAIQDSLGFIWIATEEGLNRYDGKELIKYRVDPRDSLWMTDDYLHSLFVDNKGSIWMAGMQSLMHFNPEVNEFKSFDINWESQSTFQGIPTNKITQDTRGDIWVATVEHKGLLRVKMPEMELLRYQKKEQPPPWVSTTNDSLQYGILHSNSVFSVFEQDGWLWIGYSGGHIDRLNLETNEIVPFTDKHGKRISALNSQFNELHFDADGNLWSGTDQGLAQFNEANEHFELVPIASKRNIGVHQIKEDDEGMLWLATYKSGLAVYDRKTKRSHIYQHEKGNQQSLKADRVRSLSFDHSGNIWVSTGAALSKADLSQKPFKYARYSDFDAQSLSDNGVFSVSGDHINNVWVGTQNGLNKIHLPTGTIKKIYHDPDDPESIASNQIWSVLVDSEDSLWIGYQDHGIDILKAGTSKFIKQNIEGVDENDRFTIYRFYEDSKKRIWIGSNHGVFMYDRIANTYLQINPDPDNIVNCRAFYEDNNGILWIGLIRKGLYGIDMETLEFVHHYSKEDAGGLVDNFIFTLFTDRDGLLWVGTDQGLNILKRDLNGQPTGEFYTFMEGDLRQISIMEIQEDARGSIWIATDKGILKAEKRHINNDLEVTFRKYDKNDGLISNAFYIGPNHKDENGEIYFGGDQGLVFFDPLAIKDNVVEPKMAITNVQILHKEVKVNETDEKGRLLLTKTVPYTQNINLDYSDRVITLNFAALHFNNVKNNKYKYRLVGFDDQWRDALSIQQATYTNLPAGKFVFEVIGSNMDGIWSQKPAQLTLNIAPPFWETAWFRLFALIFSGSGLALFHYIRTRAIRTRNVMLENRVAARTEELNSKNVLLNEANVELTYLMEELDGKNKLLEKALESNKEILGVTAHDLKNPLGGVIGLAEIILSDADSLEKNQFIEETKSNVDLLRSEAENMLNSIINLLDRYRGEDNREMNRERVNLKEIIKNVLRWNEQPATKKSITLNDDNLKDAWVLVDIHEVQRVIDNLISNAIKYSYPDTVITLDVNREDNYAKFTIHDEGPGLTKEDKSKVFGKMQRLSAKPTGGEHSTGLGLYIVKELIEKHSGMVGVDSVLGEGASFWFKLPLDDSHQAIAGMAAKESISL